MDEVEPIEEEAADENAVAPQATHLASTQTVTHEYLTQSGKVMRETVRTDGTVTSVLPPHPSIPPMTQIPHL